MPLSMLATAYISELRRIENSSKLLVMFSSSLSHAFYKYAFNCNVAFVADKNLSYYTEGADALSAAIRYTARKLNCDKIVTMGSSKGGYAALLHASMGAAFSELAYHAIAFGPQTRIYPQNREVNFPSYLRLMEAAKIDADIRRELVLFGSLPDVFPASSSADIYYSALNREDSAEARRVIGHTVKHVPLPMSGHLCHLAFAMDTSNQTVVRNIVDRSYAQGVALGEQTKDDRETYVQELLALQKQPGIVQLVDDALSNIGEVVEPYVNRKCV